jgi:hypothetical protein
MPYAGNAAFRRSGVPAFRRSGVPAFRRSGVPEQYLIDFLTMWLVRESQLRFL